MAKLKKQPVESDDPIVDEVRTVREKIWAEYGGDIERLSKDARAIAKEWGMKTRKAPAGISSRKKPRASGE